MNDCCEGCKEGTECTWPTDSWVCEVCATMITEDEYRVWGTCEACERKWCDDVDAANAQPYRCDPTPKDDPELVAEFERRLADEKKVIVWCPNGDFKECANKVEAMEWAQWGHCCASVDQHTFEAKVW